MIRARVYEKFGETATTVMPYDGIVVKFKSMKLISIAYELKDGVKFFQGKTIEQLLLIFQRIFKRVSMVGKTIYVSATKLELKEISKIKLRDGDVDSLIGSMIIHEALKDVVDYTPLDFTVLGGSFIDRVQMMKSTHMKGLDLEPVQMYFTCSADLSVESHLRGVNYFSDVIHETIVPMPLMAFEQDLNGKIVYGADHENQVVKNWIAFEKAKDIFNTSLVSSGLSVEREESNMKIIVFSCTVKEAKDAALSMINSGSDELFIIGSKIKGEIA